MPLRNTIIKRMSEATVRIYTKKDCCLCDEAKAEILEARKQREFRLEVVDIETDPALMAEYGEQIPVIFVNDRKAFKFRLSSDDLLKKLDKATKFTK